MTDDPDRYRKLERQDRNTLRIVVIGTFVSVVLLAGFVYLAWQNHQLLAAHSGEIAQTRAASENAARAASEAKAAVQALTGPAVAADKAEALAVVATICTALHVTCPGIPSGNSAVKP